MNRISSYIERHLPQLLMLAVMLVFCAFAVPHGHAGVLMGAPMLIGMADPAPVSPTDVRIVDPVLTNIAVGYQNSQMIGGSLFPRVPVGLRGGNVITFGRESFRQYNLRRSPGSRTKRIQFGYTGAPYATVQDSLDVPVPREYQQEAQTALNIDLGMRATRVGMNSILLALEIDQANLARNAANYDNNHKIDLTASKWSAANDPTPDVETGREEIRDSIGVYPNVLVLGAKAFTAAKNNAAIVDRFKYTSDKSITEEMLAQLWNLDKVVVGKAIYMDDADNVTDIWGTDGILAYVPQELTSIEVPSYGYTYTLNGSPYVEQPYWSPEEKSWVYGVTMERTPQLTGVLSGYLMQNLAV